MAMLLLTVVAAGEPSKKPEDQFLWLNLTSIRTNRYEETTTKMVFVISDCYVDFKTPRSVPPPKFDHEDVLVACDAYACAGDETYIVYDTGNSYCKVEKVIG